jgi:TDG/mug DNA glycosylase family protein
MLPDVLEYNLDVVFCGTAAGKKSASVGEYYAHPGNLFWKIIYQAGFVDRPMKSSEFNKVSHFGIGLTDLNKIESGVDAELNKGAFDIKGLEKKISRIKPKVLAFTSKNAAKAYFDKKKLEFGEQNESINKTNIWILPSTSGQARKHWPKLKHHWFDLAEYIKYIT